MFERNLVTPERLAEVADDLIREFGDQRVFALYGAMGAGKTTFIQAVCRQLGSDDTVTSPTFAIVNEYALNGGSSVYHFDFYRIRDLEEAFDLGYEDYFYGGSYCLIEWPERIEALLPEKYVRVEILVEPDDTRCIRAFLNPGQF
jgi:tRNA threonylcarbamoyladenosine biosynthesis protein TsaE